MSRTVVSAGCSTIDFIQQSGVVTAMVGMLQAIPGTRLYERLEQEGRLQAQLTGDNADGTTNIVPAMELETLRAGYRRIMETIYAPAHYYQRVKTFLHEYGQPKTRAPLDKDYLMAFVRSVFRLGIVGEERGEYWRLLTWTLRHRPSLLPHAVTLAIYGHHFRRVCELNVR